MLEFIVIFSQNLPVFLNECNQILKNTVFFAKKRKKNSHTLYLHLPPIKCQILVVNLYQDSEKFIRLTDTIKMMYHT